MSRLKLNKRIVAGLIFIVFIGIIIGYFLILQAVQITPAEANKKCEDFYQDVNLQINAVSGYKVLKGDKDCTTQQDEFAGTDYILSVRYLVSNGAPSSVDEIKANINYLSDQLPKTNYPVWVDNVPANNSRPELLCVSASRYIDNNGKDYPQGPPDHYPRYTVPGSIEGFAPCSDL